MCNSPLNWAKNSELNANGELREEGRGIKAGKEAYRTEYLMCQRLIFLLKSWSCDYGNCRCIRKEGRYVLDVGLRAFYVCIWLRARFVLSLYPVKEVVTVSCNQGHANLTIASALRVVTGKLAAIPDNRLAEFLTSCISHRPIRQFMIKLPGRVGGRLSRGVECIRTFMARLGQAVPSVPMRCCSRQFASILTRGTVLSKKLGGGGERSGKLMSRVDTIVVLRSCLRGGGCRLWGL